MNNKMQATFQHLQAEPSQPRRVVVLGAGGFIGSQLVAELNRLRIPVRPVRSQEVDRLQENSVEKFSSLLLAGDVVVFVAAITPDKGKDTTAFMNNLKMAVHAVKAMKDVPLAQLIYISSDAVFPEDLPPIDELTLPSTNPYFGLYGLMHQSREKILMELAGEKKLPYLILRPCSVYGAGDTHGGYGPNRFVKTAQTEGKIRLFGQGEEQRPHLYIKDFIAILIASLQHQTIGVLHAAPAPSHSFGAVAREVAAVIGAGVVIESLPRSGPVTHKHFVDTGLRRAFPSLRLHGLQEGLKEIVGNASKI